jgi:hypothetical protein
MEVRQETPVVEVPPRVEVAPMVGRDGLPSIPQHPAAPEDETDEARATRAGSTPVLSRILRETDGSAITRRTTAIHSPAMRTA